MLRPLIEDLLHRQAGIDTARLADPNARLQDLGIDSLGMVELLFEIEDKYDFHVEDPMRFAQMTLDELVADLERTIRVKHGGVIPESLAPPARVDA